MANVKIPRWFDRTFPDKPPIELFPFVIERLRGAPPRLEERVSPATADILTRRISDAWSIQEHVGHLGDLEPLWLGRVEDLFEGRAELRPADLTNRKTHEADHNNVSLTQLLGAFRSQRKHLVDRLEAMESADAGRSALHPRLKQPMRLIDLCFFVADHDDHHLALIGGILRESRTA